MEVGHGDQSPTARLIWLIGSPIVFLVGVVGNSITIAVFLKQKEKKSSTTVYFIWLAFADTMVLLIEVPRWLLIYTIQYDIRHYSDIVCKLHMFGVVYSSTTSTYVLLALTIERLISTIRPHQLKTICTPMCANIFCVCVLSGGILMSGLMMYGYGLTHIVTSQLNTVENDNITDCQNGFRHDCNGDNTATVEHTLEHTTMLSTSDTDVLRTTTITPDSVLHEKAVCTWYRQDKYRLVQTMDEVVHFFFGILLVEAMMIIADLIIIYRLMSSGAHRSSDRQRGHIKQITVTLLTVNTVFIVCRTPVFVFMSFVNQPELNKVPEFNEVFWAVGNVLFFTNHSVNIFLYVLIGKRFRNQVKDMLCGWRKKPEVVYGMVVSAVSGSSTQDSKGSLQK